ncbi:hypothetical protein [Micromonospora sp. LOL_015]|uniref:hypothetical protein n=1 Tax=Micromonospora sp. LOL_015 TaxID=3345416 RepID=UPI003A865C83
MIKLPPEILERVDVRQALKAGDWATVLQVVTTQTRVSQTEIAQAVGISQPHVSRLLTGRSRDPGFAPCGHFATAWGYLDLWPACWMNRRVTRTAANSSPQPQQPRGLPWSAQLLEAFPSNHATTSNY